MILLPVLAVADEPAKSPEEILAALDARLPEEAAAVIQAVYGLLAGAGAYPADVRAEAHIVRGKAHWLLEDMEAALGDFHAALGLVGPAEDPVRYGRILINAGAVHYRLEAFAEAEPLFREALAIAEAQGVERMRAAAWTNLGLLLTETGDFERARRKFHWARDFYERRGDAEELGRVLHNEGILEREAGAYAAAVERFERAIAIHRSRGDFPEVARSLRHRAETYMRMGLPDAAVLQAEVALEILQGRDLPLLVTPIHAVLAQAYAATGRWEEALAAERAYGQGRQEVLARQQSTTLEQARLRFQAEVEAGHERARAAEAALTEAELSRARAELARRTWQLAAMAAVGVTLLVVIAGLVLRGRFRARIQQELRDLNNRLTEALARARAMAENASAADRAKGEVLAGISHEIRAPLNSVVGLTSVLQESSLDEEQRGLVGSILGACRDLLDTLDGILDYSKVESGTIKLARELFDPCALLHEVAGVFRCEALRNGLRMETAVAEGVPPEVRGDRARVRQILVNLVANAVKFTRQGAVGVRLSAQPADDGKVRLVFSVSDTGPGVPPREQERIFQPFVQLDPAVSGRSGGVGLGLSISVRLARAMGGDIHVEDNPGGGSVFRAEVVVNAADAGNAAGKLPRQSAGKSPLVALVDPVPTSRRILSLYLDRTGAAVVEGSGMDDLGRMRAGGRGMPDLCIIDEGALAGPPAGAAAQLPDGFASTPVILLARANGSVAAPAADNLTILRKPVRRADLEAAVRRLTEPTPIAPES